MPYSHKSLAAVWLITFGLFVLTGSGAVPGGWLFLLLPVALAVPALILRSPAGAAAASHEGPQADANERARSALDPGAIDVYRWENEGGARRAPASGGIREPVRAAR
jgi:hypothetical protein